MSRTTKDVDIVALLDEHEQVMEPVPLPAVLLQAAFDAVVDLDAVDHNIAVNDHDLLGAVDVELDGAAAGRIGGRDRGGGGIQCLGPGGMGFEIHADGHVCLQEHCKIAGGADENGVRIAGEVDGRAEVLAGAGALDVKLVRLADEQEIGLTQRGGGFDGNQELGAGEWMGQRGGLHDELVVGVFGEGGQAALQMRAAGLDDTGLEVGETDGLAGVGPGEAFELTGAAFGPGSGGIVALQGEADGREVANGPGLGIALEARLEPPEHAAGVLPILFLLIECRERGGGGEGGVGIGIAVDHLL